MKNIRNFSIIAHIDHGKSTWADRIIQECGSVSDREMSAQVMDTMDIEKDRGITIKAQSVRLDYIAKNGEKYILNLIDTPGHVEASYMLHGKMNKNIFSSLEGSDLIIYVTDIYEKIFNNTFSKRVTYPVARVVKHVEIPF